MDDKPLFEDITEKSRVMRFLNKAGKSEETQEHSYGLLDDGKDKDGLLFSKGLCVFSDSLFFLAIVYSISTVSRVLDMALVNTQINNISALATILASVLAGTGALATTSHVWYYKKTQTGHSAKTQAKVYLTVADKEVECKQALMHTQHDLKLSDTEANRANIQRVDSMTAGTFNDLNTNLKTSMSDATSLIKKETGA